MIIGGFGRATDECIEMRYQCHRASTDIGRAHKFSRRFAMRRKEILELGLRLIAAWTLLSAIGSMALVAGIAASPGPVSLWMALPAGISVLAYSAFSMVLLLYAPLISSWFYRSPHADESSIPVTSNRIDLTDVYEVIVRILGLYAVLLAVKPASRVLGSIVRFAWSGASVENLDHPSSIECVSYICFAFICLFKAGSVASLFVRPGKGQQTVDGRGKDFHDGIGR